MNLYHVQDSDRPMWVVADDYGDAERRWRSQIAGENECPPGDCDPPDGVSLVASGTDKDEFPEVLVP